MSGVGSAAAEKGGSAAADKGGSGGAAATLAAAEGRNAPGAGGPDRGKGVAQRPARRDTPVCAVAAPTGAALAASAVRQAPKAPHARPPGPARAGDATAAGSAAAAGAALARAETVDDLRFRLYVQAVRDPSAEFRACERFLVFVVDRIALLWLRNSPPAERCGDPGGLDPAWAVFCDPPLPVAGADPFSHSSAFAGTEVGSSAGIPPAADNEAAACLAFLVPVVRNCELSGDALVRGLFLLAYFRFRYKQTIPVSWRTVRLIFLCALMDSAKLGEDYPWRNSHFAKTAKIPLARLNRAERHFLALIDFQVGVSRERLELFLAKFTGSCPVTDASLAYAKLGFDALVQSITTYGVAQRCFEQVSHLAASPPRLLPAPSLAP
jgi:Cyclin